MGRKYLVLRIAIVFLKITTILVFIISFMLSSALGATMMMSPYGGGTFLIAVIQIFIASATAFTWWAFADFLSSQVDIEYNTRLTAATLRKMYALMDGSPDREYESIKRGRSIAPTGARPYNTWEEINERKRGY